MSGSEPACVVLAVSASAPSAPAALAEALEGHSQPGRGPIRLLLVGEGLDWLDEPGLGASARQGQVQVSVCSRSAREQGRRLEDAPSFVTWSSVGVWLLEQAAAPQVWLFLP